MALLLAAITCRTQLYDKTHIQRNMVEFREKIAASEQLRNFGWAQTKKTTRAKINFTPFACLT